MNANVKGALKDLNRFYKIFTHNGKSLKKSEVKNILMNAINKGYETIYDIPDEEVEKWVN